MSSKASKRTTKRAPRRVPQGGQAAEKETQEILREVDLDEAQVDLIQTLAGQQTRAQQEFEKSQKRFQAAMRAILTSYGISTAQLDLTNQKLLVTEELDVDSDTGRQRETVPQ